MTDYRDELLNNALMRMQQSGIAEKDLELIKLILVSTIGEYEITDRCTEVALLDDRNWKILQMYLESKTASGRSHSTKKVRKSILKRFTEEINKPYEEITSFDVMLWLYSQQGKVELSYLSGQRSTISSFFSWLKKMNFVKDNPVDLVDKIKFNRAKVKSFSDEELEQLKQACNRKKPYEIAMVHMFLSTGLRCAELCNLKWSDIDFESRIVTVVEGKGGKSRTTAMSKVAKMYLKMYKNSIVEESEYVFPAKFKGELKCRTTSSVEKWLRKLGERARVEDAHPHRFRHNFATNLYKQGADLHMIQLALGHANINTTLIYIDDDTEILCAELKKYA